MDSCKFLHLELKLVNSAFSSSLPTSETARPLRRFIKVITITRTKKTRKEKVAGARAES